MQQKLYDYYSNVRPQKINWLWFPYIPYGKLTVLQGDPGDGKSTFMLQIAALLSKGLPMPDGYRVTESQNIIYQCSEDNLADTVKPRLMDAGADCTRIAFIVDNDERLTLEDERIEKTLAATQARLLIIDPIQAYLTQDYDMQNAIRVRTVLGGLADIAGKYQCAVVLVGHMNKSSGGKDLYRGLGSIDIAAVARSVLMIARDRGNPALRYMIPVKASLAPEGCAIAFSLTREAGFQWNGICSVDVNTLLACESDLGNKLTLACKYLDELLSLRDMPSKEVYDKMARILPFWAYSRPHAVVGDRERKRLSVPLITTTQSQLSKSNDRTVILMSRRLTGRFFAAMKRIVLPNACSPIPWVAERKMEDIQYMVSII